MGQYGFEQSGTQDFSFLSQTFYARPAGMAYAYTAAAEGVDGLGINPAGLINGDLKELVSLSFKKNFLDVNSGEITYPFSSGNGIRYALSVNYANYGEITETNKDGNETGRALVPSRHTISLSAARQIGKIFKGGLTFKIPTQYLGDFQGSQLAAGWGIDAGVQIQPVTRRAALGLSVINAGRKVISHMDEGNDGGLLPLELKAGVMFISLNNNDLRYVIDMGMPYHDYAYVSGGFEYKLSKLFQFRSGSRLNIKDMALLYNKFVESKAIKDAEGMTSMKFTGGVSITAGNFALDYAAQYWYMLGIAHLFTLKWHV